MDAGLERVNVICRWEEGWRKRVPVSRFHRDKRVGKSVFSVIIKFKRVGVFESWKLVYFAQMKPLILFRQNKSHNNIYKKEKGRARVESVS